MASPMLFTRTKRVLDNNSEMQERRCKYLRNFIGALNEIDGEFRVTFTLHELRTGIKQ